MEEHGKTTGAWERAGEIPTCRDPQDKTLGRARVKLPEPQFATSGNAPIHRFTFTKKTAGQKSLRGREWHFSITMCEPNLCPPLKRKATEVISQLATDQEPVLITQHGLPAAYLIDVQMYEGMQSRLTLLEGIARGEKAILEKRVLSNREARQRMARWLA